jgi:exodeoxyribonuclease VII large subunit
LWQHNPAVIISSYKQRQEYLSRRLIAATLHKLEQSNQRFLSASQTLHAVSPLATLNRGYAMAIKLSTGEIIRSIEQVSIGDRVQTRLGHGRFTSQVKDINED